MATASQRLAIAACHGLTVDNLQGKMKCRINIASNESKNKERGKRCLDEFENANESLAKQCDEKQNARVLLFADSRKRKSSVEQAAIQRYAPLSFPRKILAVALGFLSVTLPRSLREHTGQFLLRTEHWSEQRFEGFRSEF